jgi:hypothetical protein
MKDFRLSWLMEEGGVYSRESGTPAQGGLVYGSFTKPRGPRSGRPGAYSGGAGGPALRAQKRRGRYNNGMKNTLAVVTVLLAASAARAGQLDNLNSAADSAQKAQAAASLGAADAAYQGGASVEAKMLGLAGPEAPVVDGRGGAKAAPVLSRPGAPKHSHRGEVPDWRPEQPVEKGLKGFQRGFWNGFEFVETPAAWLLERVVTGGANFPVVSPFWFFWGGAGVAAGALLLAPAALAGLATGAYGAAFGAKK